MTEEIKEPRFLTVPEAARLCGVTRNTLYTWVRKGRLSAYRTPGRTNLIRPVDLIQFMQNSGMFVPANLQEKADQDDKSWSSIEPEGDAMGGRSVLVVDADPALRSVVVRALQGRYRVFQAQTGFEGLHLMTLHPEIAVVLLEEGVPGQPTEGVLAELHRLPSPPRVILMRGQEADESETEAGQEVSALLTKPFRVKELSTLVNRTLA